MLPVSISLGPRATDFLGPMTEAGDERGIEPATGLGKKVGGAGLFDESALTRDQTTERGQSRRSLALKSAPSARLPDRRKPSPLQIENER